VSALVSVRDLRVQGPVRPVVVAPWRRDVDQPGVLAAQYRLPFADALALVSPDQQAVVMWDALGADATTRMQLILREPEAGPHELVVEYGGGFPDVFAWRDVPGFGPAWVCVVIDEERRAKRDLARR